MSSDRRKARLAVLRLDGNRCHCCGARLTLRTMSLDHVIPRDLFGPDAHWNLVGTCWSCNQAKSRRRYEHFTGCPVLPRRAREHGVFSTEVFLRERREADQVRRERGTFVLTLPTTCSPRRSGSTGSERNKLFTFSTARCTLTPSTETHDREAG